MAKYQLKNVRLTFPQVFEAKQVNGKGEAKFSAAALISRADPQMPEIKAAIAQAAKEKWGEAPTDAPGLDGTTIKLPKFQAMLKQLQAADKLCLHDGDGKSDYDGYAGHFFINASNKIRPLVIGGGPDGRAPLVASDGKIYSGCYVNMIVEFWGQDNDFGKRVNASLLGIQFVKDGERLAGGGVAAADDFEAIPAAGAAAVADTGKGAASLF